MLHAVVRLSEHELFEGELPASRHRRIHSGLLHQETAGLVELAAGRRTPDGELVIYTRERADHYLHGGGWGDPGWLDRLIALAARHRDDDERREELFIAPCERRTADGHKRSVTQTRWLWVDVDERERLPALWAFLERRPPHLVVESAGVSGTDEVPTFGAGGAPEVLGGVHAYWRLAEPLRALELRCADGEFEVIDLMG
jgi:hypothetical protein